MLADLPDQILFGEIFARAFDGDEHDVNTWLAFGSVCRCAGRLLQRVA